MNGAVHGVFEQIDEVRLCSFLETENRLRLDSSNYIAFFVVFLYFLQYLPNEPLEWKLAKQKISRLLILSDLSQCDGSRSVTMWFFRTVNVGNLFFTGWCGQTCPGLFTAR